MDASKLLAQVNQANPSSGSGVPWGTGSVLLWVLSVMAFWKVFVKAKQPGWAAIIPIYSTYVLLKMIARPWWWLLLFLIPIVNIVVAIVVAFDVAKVFGKSKMFGFFGLFVFSVIGYLILGFGDAKYKGLPKR
jgi:hypothetical protein